MHLKSIALSVIWMPILASPVLADMQTVVALDSQLKIAICDQNWRRAIEITDELIKQPELPVQYRQILLHMQRQFRSLDSNPEATYISSCGVKLNWARAATMFHSGSPRSGATNSPSTFYPYRLGGIGDGIPGNGPDTGGSSRSSAAVSPPSYSGNCQYSSQRDAAGNACGGRAASERPGGF